MLAFDLQLSTLRPLFRVRGGGGSCELIERHVAAGWGSGFKQGIDAAHGFGYEQAIAANVADLCGNVVDHDYLTPLFDGVDDRPGLIDAGASRSGRSPQLMSRGASPRRRLLLQSDVGRGGAYAHRILLIVQQGDQLLPEFWEGMHRNQVGGRGAH